jgi:hypothetical protein
MQQWDVVRIHCADLVPPHDKFCICICPENRLFMFINSEPPKFRKARDLAVEIANFEVHFLNHTSYIDTTRLMQFDPAVVDAAWADQGRQMGRIAPAIRARICAGVLAHEVMPESQRALFR